MLETNEMEVSEGTAVTVVHESTNLEDKNLKKRTSTSPQKSEPVTSGTGDDSPGEHDSETMGNKRIRSSPNIADEAGSESPVIPEKLEVPSTELQFIQKQVLIEKLMGSTTPCSKDEEESMDVQMENQDKSEIIKNRSTKAPFRKPAPPPKQDLKKTFKMRSSLLDRVKSFLPEMKNANEDLLRLPDPSKISLESDSDISDRDEMDGAVAGPSGTSKKPAIPGGSKSGESKTYVEMNLALVAQSDSDTSSDDEESYLAMKGSIKGLPVLPKGLAVSPVKSTYAATSTEESPKVPEDLKKETEKKSLITELN